MHHGVGSLQLQRYLVLQRDTLALRLLYRRADAYTHDTALFSRSSRCVASPTHFRSRLWMWEVSQIGGEPGCNSAVHCLRWMCPAVLLHFLFGSKLLLVVASCGFSLWLASSMYCTMCCGVVLLFQGLLLEAPSSPPPHWLRPSPRGPILILDHRSRS